MISTASGRETATKKAQINLFYFLGKLPFPVFFPILVCLMRWEHQNISLCFKKATFCAHFFGYTFWSPVFAITMRLCLANNFYAALKVASEASWDELDGGGEGEQAETTWSGFDTTLIFQFATPLQYLNPLASPSFQRTRNRLLRVGQTNMNSRPVHKNLFLEFPKYPGKFMLHFDI